MVTAKFVRFDHISEFINLYKVTFSQQGHVYSGLEVSFEKSKETKNKCNTNFFFDHYHRGFFFSIMTSFFLFFCYFFFFFFLETDVVA